MSETLLVLEEFFAPSELLELWRYAQLREGAFTPSEVVGEANDGEWDDDVRRSRVLYDVSTIYPLIAERIMAHLPLVTERLDLDPFTVREIELQVTSTNDGEWFRPHRDSGAGAVRSRELTFVYYCHREPRAFRGGELRLYEPFADVDDPDGQSVTIVPAQNAMVFFPSHYFHEVLPTWCPTGAFADARLTFNGWLHR